MNAGVPGPRISFAIPYYDNPAYLTEAVASVRAQTVDDWDLVVMDDAGPEPVEDLVHDLGDPRVRYVRNGSRLGLPGNWNKCLRQAHAPLVTLLHGDDRLLPTYAAEVLAAAQRQPDAAAVFTGARVIGSDGAPTRTMVDAAKSVLARGRDLTHLQDDRGLALLLGANLIYCPSLAIRRTLVGPEPFDPRWRFVADWDFTVRQLMARRSLIGVDLALLEYRRHAAQTTARLSVDTRRFEEELEFLRLMAVEAADRGYPRAARAARRRLTTRGHLAVHTGADLLRGRLASARAKAGLLTRDLVVRG